MLTGSWRNERMNARIILDQKKIAEFCQRWKITEFALFGSVLRNDFRSDSDVDVLVTFASQFALDSFSYGPDAERIAADRGSQSRSR